MKKLFAVLLALTLVLSMGTIAFAEGETTPSGKITISNAVSGEDYTIYKMFAFAPVDGSTTQGRYSYADAKWEAFITTGAGKDYLEFDATNGTIEWKGNTVTQDGAVVADPVEVAALAKAAVAYARANDIAGTKKTATGAKVEFTELGLGYYAIDTSLGNICALTNADSTFTATEKNNGAIIDKKIVENGALVDANNVAIGDTVNYQSVITAGKGTVNYVAHDKFSTGLDFKADSVVVKVDYKAEEKTDKTLVAGENNDYVLTTGCTDGCTFEINFSDAFEATLSEGDKIIITYSATLNDEAVIGSTGNPNEIHLTYGNAQTTTKDTVITYTTKLTIDKTDAQGTPLPGAGFTLYKGTVADANKVGTEIKSENLTTFEWKGLEAGTYVLVETKVPDGYNKADDITFTITWEAPEEAITSGEEKATWSDDSDKINVAEGLFSGTVVNNTGALLPETGGIGTTIFYIVGITLMLGAAIVLISKKRMKSFA